MADVQLRDESRAPEPRQEPKGYAHLIEVDTRNGHAPGGESILVPVGLAIELNRRRRTLWRTPDNPAAWQLAGVQRSVPFPTRDEKSSEAESTGQSTTDADAATASSGPTSPPGSPAHRTPSPSVPPPASSTVRAVAAGPKASRSRASAIEGRRVPVISSAELQKRKQDIELKYKFTTAERKAEDKFMDELIARGEMRTVGLKKDWRALLGKLHRDMPNFGQVIERIEGCCALAQTTRRPLHIPALLLAGLPGVGKTYFATRLASVLGVAQFVYAMESAETVAALCGSEKHWSNAEFGQLFRMIMLGPQANPVVVLDELDKVTTGNNYRPANALHAVLEPMTASTLRDKCIDLQFDASYVVYIATANRLSTIDGSLLSRFELFHIQVPEPRAAVSIARAIGLKVLKELNLERRFEPPSGEVVQQLALLSGPRQMHQTLKAALGRALMAGRTRVRAEDLVARMAGQASDGDGDDRPH